MNAPRPRPSITIEASPGAELRARAASALSKVVFEGVSLRLALAAAQAEVGDPRDRAFLAALLHDGARWWLRYDAALQAMLTHALAPRANPVHALLVLGLVQLAVLELPGYAVVAASVDAARQLGWPRLAGLVNAVLRRFQRERAALEAHLDAEPSTRHAHPPWLIAQLERDWPAQAQAILAANNREAPLYLRVNRRRARRAALLADFAGVGVEASALEGLEDAVVLGASTDVRHLPGYAEGRFSVQDGAAQRVAPLLDLQSGQRVLDACAAPGGKSAQILERAEVALTALDRDPERLPRLHENLSRLGLAATVLAGDAGDPCAWWDRRPFDRILLDAPCSASGIIRRQPDIKLHRRADDVAALAGEQRKLLGALWPLLAPGGKLVYATCSLLRAENEEVLAGFLAHEPQAQALPLPADVGHAAGMGRQNLPGEGGMDGFFYALLEKRG